jgi:hypothetical protein
MDLSDEQTSRGGEGRGGYERTNGPLVPVNHPAQAGQMTEKIKVKVVVT